MISFWSRNLKDVTSPLATATLTLQRDFFKRFAPWQLVVTRTAVSLDVQEAIHLQGRADLKTVNAARAAAGLWPITAAENHEVSWCAPMKSLHVVGPGIRALAEAVDLAIAIDPDGPTGPLKPVIDWKNGRYAAMALMAKLLGCEAGYDFSPRDPGHIQMRSKATC